MIGSETDEAGKGYIKVNAHSSDHVKGGKGLQWQPLPKGEGNNEGYIQGLFNDVQRVQLQSLETTIL